MNTSDFVNVLPPNSDEIISVIDQVDPLARSAVPSAPSDEQSINDFVPGTQIEGHGDRIEESENNEVNHSDIETVQPGIAQN